MGSAVLEEHGRLTCAANFGNGRTADLEYRGQDSLWVAAGSGISLADVWMKAADESMDLRVRIERIGSGLKVTVDRGEQSTAWWTPEGTPRLTIAVNQPAHTASASASGGVGARFQEVDLGEVAI